jgi:hypothetical protein
MAAPDMHTTTEELVGEEVFSMQSVPRLYNGDRLLSLYVLYINC